MASLAASINEDIRSIEVGDLDRMVAIDRAHTGSPRRRFFEKRLAAAAAHPQDFVQIGLTRGGMLRGFAIARLLRGEFGLGDVAAVLDVLDIEPESRDRGLGQALVDRMVDIMAQKGVHSLYSQASWTNHQLLRFFHAAEFELSPRIVVCRSVSAPLIETIGEGSVVVTEKHEAVQSAATIPTRVGDAAEINYGTTVPDFSPLARDEIPVRGMKDSDLLAITAIDRQIVGRDRSEYFTEKLQEALFESGVRVSLVAERDNRPVGFIMARVDLGEFGRFEPNAILDTIGVDADYRNQGIGRALLSQLLLNLNTLRIDRVSTEVDWRDRELLAFLDHCSFVPAPELCFVRAIAGAENARKPAE